MKGTRLPPHHVTEEIHMKRPLTIWLTQCFLIIFALLFLCAFLINLFMLLSRLDQAFSVIRAVVGYAVILGFIALLMAAFWGLVKRAKYGRWLAVVSLILLWGLLILTQVSGPSGPYQYYEYDNNAQLAGAMLVQVLLHGLILMLILRLWLSKKIGKFFASHVEVS
jgi:hypothetical protein